MRKLLVLIVLALVAAACGGDGASASFQGPAITDATAPVSAIDDKTTEDSPAAAGPSDGVTTTVPPAAPTELPDSDYPEVVVADLAGGEVNLRELALEPRPVLLWFWAPH